MSKILVIAISLLLVGCSVKDSAEIDVENGTQSTGTVKTEESNANSGEKKEGSSTSSALNIGQGGIDPNRPRDTAEYIKSYFYIDEDIITRDDYSDNRERMLIGAHNVIVINKDGYVDSIILPNLYKNDVENLFEDLNIQVTSSYAEVFDEMENVNFEEESGSLSKMEMLDGVLVGLKNNTNFDVKHSDRDKPFSVILAFDEDTIEQLKEQNHF